MTTSQQIRQPWMHDMRPILTAPAQLWAESDGTVDASAPHAGAANLAGYYVGDTRILSRIVAHVNGEAPTPISWRSAATGRSVTSLVARNIDGPTVDPSVRVTETRELTPATLAERFEVAGVLTEPVELDLAVTLRFDMATMQEIKGGTPSAAAASGQVVIAVPHDGKEPAAHVTYGSIAVDVTPDAANVASETDTPVPTITVDGLNCTFAWHLTVPARGSVSVGLTIAVDAKANAVTVAASASPWADITVHAADSRVADWANTSLRDLAGLRMAIPALPDDEFLAAGAPWFFTLFGRDSLWAARFMLPLTTRTAMGTLRTLAHFQATESNAETNADPGKIMHELRAETLVQTGAFDDGMRLPPLYYGTIDATPLWIILLGEALRWGAPEDEVRALLPNLEAALAWLRDWGDCDGDGFLEYIDRTGHGLSNQGWKDSGDSVRWNDGRIADGPIALCEVQGYAYQAAMLGADVLERFGRPGADEWRAWAAQLKTRFNEQFWVDDGRGRYPAIALDKDKRPVDSLTSNIGHLLGTGILDEDGVAAVVKRLVGDDMLSGYGVRTMSTLAGGYWPESYHCGSVWAHDSAIVMNGLRAEGYTAEALQVAEGLVRAAAAFDFQIPELYSGDAGENGPAPYPAACHPQAWSAASSVSVLSLLLGLEPGAPAGTTTPADSPLAQGLRIERD
ncbi:glycogen debranching N-terminal domain-containing protein [Bifidobacterium sp. SO4]|uniref:glycogen debranching N-terminal domain-containing protein n=1 Tax=Bifidobacterium sp. SO4 TaxID=2809030 RepID=UPI001BDCADB7|nr:glycogen debranching N-terminal domain-containing protein [Bifidobacterium sp. SO4]MBT1170547.1 amylo-alpha-1,6-glucosidase [Bifidobacterium sp. SO4]